MGDAGSGEIVRAKIEDVEVERRFELQAVFDIERKRINKYLERKANESLGPANATVESAKAGVQSWVREIENIFAKRESIKDINRTLLGANQELGLGAPKYRSWVVWRFMAMFFGVLEVLVGVVQGFDSEGFEPGPAVVGVLLWGGGFLLGHGWGHLQSASALRKAHERFHVPIPPNRSAGKEYAKVGIGVVMVLGMSLFRSLGGGAAFMIAAIAGFSVVLAIAIAFFESLDINNQQLYDWYHQRIFQCQQWFATEEHLKACEKDYRDMYAEHVERIALAEGKARQAAVLPRSEHRQPATT